MPIFYTDSGSFNDISVSGSLLISGNLSFTQNSGGLTGSLLGTSSWANSASIVDFTGIINKPELVSSSNQISITATNGYSTFSSSIATKNDTQDISINALNAATSSYAINSTIQSQLAGVISSSTQFNALTNTSASFASTASFVNTLTTLTASNVQLNNLTDTTSTNKVLVLNTATNQVFTTASIGTGGGASVSPGTISQSLSGDAQGQIKLNGVNVDITNLQTNDSPSFTSITTTASSSLAAIYSSSAQVVSAIAGQIIQPTTITTTNITGTGTILLQGIFSSSQQVDYNNIQNKLSGVISSSTQFNALTNTSASFAITAISASYFSGSASFPDGLTVTSLTASAGISTTTLSASAGISQFNPATVRLTVGTTAPTSPAVNDLWVDTN